MLAAKRSTSEIVTAHKVQYISNNPSKLVGQVARNIAERGSKATKPNSLPLEKALWLLTLGVVLIEKVFTYDS